MKIRFSPTTNRPYIKIKKTKYFGFKIGKLPHRFADIKKNNPIQVWYNFRGFTFVSEQEFINIFGQITIH